MQLPADFKDPDRYCIFISESTLGLPDRDYYLKDDPQLKELRAKYVAYIAQMLTLGGESERPRRRAPSWRSRPRRRRCNGRSRSAAT